MYGSQVCDTKSIRPQWKCVSKVFLWADRLVMIMSYEWIDDPLMINILIGRGDSSKRRRWTVRPRGHADVSDYESLVRWSNSMMAFQRFIVKSSLSGLLWVSLRVYAVVVVWTQGLRFGSVTLIPNQALPLGCLFFWFLSQTLRLLEVGQAVRTESILRRRRLRRRQ